MTLSTFTSRLFLKSGIPAEAPLTHVRTLGGYELLLKRAQLAEGCSEAEFTAHSPRAGYATEELLRHGEVGPIMGVTRHVSVKSLKIYLDVTSVAVGKLAQTLELLLPGCREAELELLPRLQFAFQRELQPAGLGPVLDSW